MSKLISIIIPVRNGENFLSEALDNIIAQKMDVEIIVVDDASTDRTVEIASRYGCRVISHDECRGQVVAKNTGLKYASGEFVMFHDHDDRMREGALKALYEAFDEGVSAVEAKVQDFYTPGLSEEEKKSSPIKSEPYYGLFTGAILIRRSVFDVIGDFVEGINTGEIMDWEFKMKQNGFVCRKLDMVSTDRRVHATNFGKTHRAKEFADYLSVIRARLAQNMNRK